jgi:predicted Zn-ribbon and HTH transcriptional regulator
MAKCENCGYIDVLHPRPVRGPNNYSPCPACKNVTAVYVEVAA